MRESAPAPCLAERSLAPPPPPLPLLLPLLLPQAHFQQLMRLGARLFAPTPPAHLPAPGDAGEGQQASPAAAAAAAGATRSGNWGARGATAPAPASTTGTVASADFLTFWEGLLFRQQACGAASMPVLGGA